MRAVILAGGKGTRLSPYTSVFPKPLMPIDDVPIMQVVLCQLRETGFDHVTVAVGHMASMIKTYFGDGSAFGLKLDYSHEDEPLGTIGALSLIEQLPDEFIVMNGDVLTDLNYRELLLQHQENDACATIASYSKKVNIEYGVITSNYGNQIIGYHEKPTIEYQVSMGVYAFNANILKYVPKGRYLDFPALANILVQKGEKVIQFPFYGYWMDIGCRSDYEKAAEDFVKMKGRFLRQPDLANRATAR
jgi:NDP-sugar pyrophosphorylase family protein